MNLYRKRNKILGREFIMKIGLVDDRRIDLDKLTGLFGLEGVEIIFSTTSADEAYEFIKKEAVDLLIADIEMPHLSGYELADIIHSHALNISVIFVTGNSGYAVHAFEINVHDYIMKPYSKDRLIQSVQRLLEKNKLPKSRADFILNKKTTFTLCRRRILSLLNVLGDRQRFIQNQGRLKRIRA